MSDSEFCFRVCPDGPNAAKYCQHVRHATLSLFSLFHLLQMPSQIYDTMGCQWNMPGIYTEGFTSCDGDPTLPMGVYGASTFHQGGGNTPPPHPAGASSKCVTSSAITYAASASATTSSTAAPSGSVSAGGGKSAVPSPSASSKPNSAGVAYHSSWGLIAIAGAAALAL
jgi:hypothetical protein